MTCPVKPPASLSIQLLTQRALCEGVTRYSLTSNACRQRIHQRQHTLRHQISDIRQSRRHAAPAKAHAATAELQMLAGNSNNGSLPNSLPSSTSQKQPAKQASSNKKHAAVTKSQTESLKLLEWATVCQQVATFTTTAMAAERCLAAQLPIATSQAAAEDLLQETAEAQQAKLALKGIFDLRGLLEAASRKRVLHPVHLDAIACTLEVAAAVSTHIQGNTKGGAFPALLNLGRGIKNALPELRQSIRHCIEGGRVLDRASERLGSIRQQRRSNMQSLRKDMNDWARQLASQGVSEEALVVIRRDRLCVPVKAGRQSQLPKGSVTLASSASGSTVYMEPTPVVALNNAEALLGAQEEEEEQAILAGLTDMVKGSELNIHRLLKAVTALDIASARAKHADWCGGVKPAFLTAQQADEQGSIIARGVYHPLLLEPSLDPLKDPPATEPPPSFEPGSNSASSNTVTADSFGRASWEAAPPEKRTYGNKGKRGDARPKRPCPIDLLVRPGAKLIAVTGPNTGGKTASLKTLGLTALMAKAGLFIPLDPSISIQPAAPTLNGSQPQSNNLHQDSTGTHVDQADMSDDNQLTKLNEADNSSEAQSDDAPKTNDGLHDTEPSSNGHVSQQQPQDEHNLRHDSPGMSFQQQVQQQQHVLSDAQQQQPNSHGSAQPRSSDLSQHQHHQQQQQQQQQQQHHEQPKLLFFEQVLADVGDAQDLQQSLSTFSGHITRLQGILQDVTSNSMVLLDEVGSGTDPGEGAALAGALLDALAGRAALTYATTHHAELKNRAATDSRFVNASVEFDLASLKPTYKLIWGEGGQSNALAVAEGLGFDPNLVQRACQIANHRREAEDATVKAQGLKASLQDQMQEAEHEAAQAAAAVRMAQQELSTAQQQVKELSEQQQALKGAEGRLSSEVVSVRNELSEVLAEVSAGRMSHEEAAEYIEQVASSVPSVNAAAAALKQSQQSKEEVVLTALDKERRKTWKPKVGEQVKLTKAGGTTAKVTSIGQDGILTIQMGALSMQANAADVAPTAFSTGSRAAGSSPSRKQKPADKAAPQSQSETGSKKVTVEFQADFNTVDVRGQQSQQALVDIERAIGSMPAGSAMFVVHGVATGRLRSEIHQYLSRNAQVDRFVLDRDSAGGCTIVHLRQ